jgi:hypothetical protein
MGKAATFRRMSANSRCVRWLSANSNQCADCCGWMRDAGFRETRVEQLTGIESMVVGIK